MRSFIIFVHDLISNSALGGLIFQIVHNCEIIILRVTTPSVSNNIATQKSSLQLFRRLHLIIGIAKSLYLVVIPFSGSSTSMSS